MIFVDTSVALADLKAMVRDAVLCHFDPQDAPRVIRLHGLAKQEMRDKLFGR